MIHPENPTIVKTVLAKFKAAVSTSLQILDMDKFRHYEYVILTVLNSLEILNFNFNLNFFIAENLS